MELCSRAVRVVVVLVVVVVGVAQLETKSATAPSKAR
jgi:hypothetical protein